MSTSGFPIVKIPDCEIFVHPKMVLLGDAGLDRHRWLLDVIAAAVAVAEENWPAHMKLHPGVSLSGNAIVSKLRTFRSDIDVGIHLVIGLPKGGMAKLGDDEIGDLLEEFARWIVGELSRDPRIVFLRARTDSSRNGSTPRFSTDRLRWSPREFASGSMRAKSREWALAPSLASSLHVTLAFALISEDLPVRLDLCFAYSVFEEHGRHSYVEGSSEVWFGRACYERRFANVFRLLDKKIHLCRRQRWSTHGRNGLSRNQVRPRATTEKVLYANLERSWGSDPLNVVKKLNRLHAYYGNADAVNLIVSDASIQRACNATAIARRLEMTLTAADEKALDCSLIEPALRFAVDYFADDGCAGAIDSKGVPWAARLDALATAGRRRPLFGRRRQKALTGDASELFQELVNYGRQSAGCFLDAHPDLLEPIEPIIAAKARR